MTKCTNDYFRTIYFKCFVYKIGWNEPNFLIIIMFYVMLKQKIIYFPNVFHIAINQIFIYNVVFNNENLNTL